MLDGCGIETPRTRTVHEWTPRCASRSMLDGCGIETQPFEISAQRRVPASSFRSRSMLDGCGIENYIAKRGSWGTVRSVHPRRDRCSMAVESRPTPGGKADHRWPSGSRSMLDGCGIETLRDDRASGRAHLVVRRDRCSMAVESRHVPHLRVNPRHAGRDRCSMAVESRPPSRHHPSQGSVASRSMLDDCGIETGGCSAGSAPRGGRDRCSMSVESRPVTAPLRRRSWPSRDRCSMAVESRHVAFYGPVARTEVSRSMLDGCGIETCSDPLGLYPGGLVAIDARWLWNRDYSWRKGEPRWCSGRDRCSMAVESRPCGRSRSGALDPCSSRSMLDGCGIET